MVVVCWWSMEEEEEEKGYAAPGQKEHSEAGPHEAHASPTRPQTEGACYVTHLRREAVTFLKYLRVRGRLKLITANSTRRHQKSRTKSEPCSISSHINWKRSAKDNNSNLCRSKQKQTQLETHVPFSTIQHHSTFMFSFSLLSCAPCLSFFVGPVNSVVGTDRQSQGSRP